MLDVRGHLAAAAGGPGPRFGEFLVEAGAIDRFQLLRALQLQDRTPAIRLGEAVAILGYATARAIERLYDRFQREHEPPVASRPLGAPAVDPT
jgi:hypothetical protein